MPVASLKVANSVFKLCNVASGPGIHVQCQMIDHTQSEGISLMGSVCLFATRLLSTVVNKQHA